MPLIAGCGCYLNNKDNCKLTFRYKKNQIKRKERHMDTKLKKKIILQIVKRYII